MRVNRERSTPAPSNLIAAAVALLITVIVGFSIFANLPALEALPAGQPFISNPDWRTDWLTLVGIHTGIIAIAGVALVTAVSRTTRGLIAGNAVFLGTLGGVAYSVYTHGLEFIPKAIAAHRAADCAYTLPDIGLLSSMSAAGGGIATRCTTASIGPAMPLDFLVLKTLLGAGALVPLVLVLGFATTYMGRGDAA